MRRLSLVALTWLALTIPADASTIVYSCEGRNICAVEPDGSKRRNLTSRLGGTYGSPQLSDDGRLMTFSHDSRLYTADARARNRRILPPPDPYVAGTSLADPILHHDGKTLLFRAVPMSGQNARICRIRLSRGSEPRCGRGSGRAYVSWGPKGTILSTHWDERKDICITSLDGKCTRELIRIDEEWTTFFQEPATSPDGRFIAAATETFDDNRIKLFDARTGRHIRDLTGRHGDLLPTWSPSGRHVAFTRGVRNTGSEPAVAICYVGIGGGKVRCPVPKVTDRQPLSAPSWGG
ncbi:MAG TPA: hypothetical protein VF715_05530 [Thermoleophilaceae bacterium]|jgi:Tol biopolymer transport system component